MGKESFSVVTYSYNNNSVDKWFPTWSLQTYSRGSAKKEEERNLKWVGKQPLQR